MPARQQAMLQCSRAAYMRPLQCEINNAQTINGRQRIVSAGGIYAAPTHGPNAVANPKPLLWGVPRAGFAGKPAVYHDL